LEFVVTVEVKKTRVIPLSDGGKGLMICAFVQIQYQSVTGRRMDRWAISHFACIACWHMIKM